MIKLLLGMELDCELLLVVSRAKCFGDAVCSRCGENQSVLWYGVAWCGVYEYFAACCEREKDRD